MDWVESKSIWCLRPDFAEVFVGGEAFEGLESSGEVVGSEEVVQVRFELVVGVVELSLDGGVLDGSVHALDLPVGPGVVGPGQSVFDSMKKTEPVEGMATEAGSWTLAVLRQIGELDAVVGEHGVDALRCKTCPIVPPSHAQKSMHHQMPGLNTYCLSGCFSKPQAVV
jgi:hypothetical protein